MTQKAVTNARVEAIRPGADIFARVKELIRAHRRDDPFGLITVVVPSNYSSYYLRQRLAPGGYFNVQLTRLDDLAEKIGGSHIDRPPLTRLQAAALVYSAAMSAPPGSRLGPIRSLPSLHSALRATFRQLEALEQDPVPSLRQEGELVQEIADVYRTYRGLRGNWREQVDVARAAASELENGNYPVSELGKLIVLRIEVAPAQFAPLDRALNDIAGASILVALTGDEEADLLVAAAIPNPDPDSHSTDVSPIKRTVNLISAPDPANEVRFVVRDIVRRAKENATPFYRMAVLFADRSYGDRVEEALRFAGVPVTGPDPVPDSNSPEGRFVAGILDLFLAHLKGGWTRQGFAKWITSAPVAFPDTRQEVPAARWDAVSRLASVTAGLDGFKTRLTRYAGRQRAAADNVTESDELHEIRAASLRSQAAHAQKMIEFVEGLAAQAPATDTPDLRSYTKWLRDLWDAYLLPSGEPTPVRDRIAALFDQIEELKFPPGTAMDLEHFSTLVRDELDRTRGNLRRLGRGVFVAPLNMAVGCEFDVVHILGMSEGSYPSRDRDDPLLPETVKAKLDPSGETLPDRQRSAALERRTCLIARNTAQTQYLYWPRAQVGARRASGPARWFLEAAREVSGNQLLQPGDLLSGSSDNPVGVLPDEAPAHEAIAFPCDRHEYALKSTDSWRSAAKKRVDHFLARDRSNPLHRGLKLEDSVLTNEWTEFDGRLPLDKASRNDLGIASASRFESWANCPYQFFLAYVAKVEPTERPEDEPGITPLERGSIVHSVLEQFVSERSARRIDSRAEQRVLLRETVARHFDEYAADGSAVHPALLTIERNSITRNLERWLSAESEIMAAWGVTPYKSELTFGFHESDAPAVEIATDSGEVVRFRGRVDRVDRSTNGDRIIVFDYKTGGSSRYGGLKDDPVMGGLRLQLPVYTRAASALLQSDADSPDVRAAYWFVFEKGGSVLRPDLADQPDSAARLDEVTSMIATGINAGVFPPAPRGRPGRRDGRSELENCRWCPYDAICPADRLKTWELKRGAPEVLPYVSLSK